MDCGEVEDEGARFENLVACHLLKYAHFKEDTEGDRYHLCTLRDKEKREVDFCLVRNNEPEILVEAKVSDSEFSPSLNYYKAKYFTEARAVQVVLRAERVRSNPQGVFLKPAGDFLMELV